MIHQLPAQIRGATHVRIDEVVFSVTTQVLIIRGTFGTLSGEVFTPDPVLARAEVVFAGSDYPTAVAPLGVPFQAAVLPLIDAAGWIGGGE